MTLGRAFKTGQVHPRRLVQPMLCDAQVTKPESKRTPIEEERGCESGFLTWLLNQGHYGQPGDFIVAREKAFQREAFFQKQI